jgi:hypothetical protein
MPGSVIAAAFDDRYPEANRSLVLCAPNDSALLRLQGVESRLRNVARVEAMVRVEQL